MKKAVIWIVIGAAIALAAIFLFQPKGGSGFTKLDQAGLLDLQKKGAQVVDVRSAGEYSLGHIAGAINVPVDEIQGTAASWDKDKQYVLYCASGARSASAQQTMQSMGFKSVADMTGGISQWTGPLEKGAATSQQTITTNGKPVFIEFYTPT